MRASPNLPPGDFSSIDIYSRKRWRQVQYLANQLWVGWKREYLQTMQSRQKRKVPRNFIVDDVVLVYDEHAPRGKWPLGRAVETYPDKQGRVRQALVRTSTGDVKRPISKLCLVLGKD